MVLYKGPGLGSQGAGRLDGQVWSASGAGATIRGWVTPQMSPSERFESYDVAARDLDAKWDGLAPGKAADWEARAKEVRRYRLCRWIPPLYPYYVVGIDGHELFVGTNLARQAQGLGWTDTPPPSDTEGAWDKVTLHWCGEVTALWTRPDAVGAGPFVLMVWGRPRQTFATGDGQSTRAKWCGTVAVLVGVPVSLQTVLEAGGLARWNGVLDLWFGIATLGDAPFAVGRSQVWNREREEDDVGSGICQGRLSLVSGDPAPAAEVVGAETLYFVPYQGNRVSLWTGDRWDVREFSELSLSLASVVSGKNHDVFVWSIGGVVGLVHGSAWTTDNQRVDELAYNDGVLTLEDDKCRRYVGTIRGSATGKTTDSARQRFVASWASPLRRALNLEAAGQWQYTVRTWREANGGNADGAGHSHVEFVTAGLCSVEPVWLSLRASAWNQGQWIVGNVAFGLEGALVPVGHGSCQMISGGVAASGGGLHLPLSCTLNKVFSAGYHRVAWLEISGDVAITDWYGVIDVVGYPDQWQRCGIHGVVWC